MRERVRFFDLLRCVAAIAVIAIHVLAPYRHELGSIPFEYWFTAVSINGVTRWAVPVFIMISGALMLSDTRPFDAHYYAKRRLGKVLVPFLAWSLFYALFSGLTVSGYSLETVGQTLGEGATHATYYHLGFFYYFIPLYFVIPFFQLAIRKYGESALYAYVVIWLFTTLLYLIRIDGPWSHQLWLYSGYLPLGYLLYRRVPATLSIVSLFSALGGVALLLTVYMVVDGSLAAEKYTVGRWLSYKTINVILAASMVFMLCRYVGEGLSERANRVIGFVSQHSLGIYILHPIFLWPMKEFTWHQGHPAWVIPIWIAISGAGALGMSWWLSKSSKTRWLVP